MTLPDERYRAVVQTMAFLLEICNTPRVPKEIKQRARGLLRHYPSTYHMQRAAENSPEVFAERMEDVTRLFAKYEENKTL